MTRLTCLLTLSITLVAPFLGQRIAHAADPAPTRPRVLILGDSISLGYTPLVKKQLADVADVLRPNGNCQHTGYGLQNIDTWLGDGKWDVIHFNWGIWDTHMLTEKDQLVHPEPADVSALHQRHTREQYAKNLTQLVEKVKATGATLIFATTTPITSRKGERFEAIKELNAAAAEVCKSHNVAINNLYELTLPNAAKWLSGDRVHFSGPGNEQLAKHVSEVIRQALAKRAK